MQLLNVGEFFSSDGLAARHWALVVGRWSLVASRWLSATTTGATVSINILVSESSLSSEVNC